MVTCEGSVFRYPILLNDHNYRKANVLIDSKGHAVVADYGLALIIDSSEFTSIKTAGTCRWTAPEIMNPPNNDDVPLPQFTLKSDIFSYAMTVFEVYLHSHSPCLNTYAVQKKIFAGEQPFNEKKSDGNVIFAILNGNRPVLPESIESKVDLANLVRQSWSQNPDQRPTARQICRRLGLVRVVFLWKPHL